jgi:hypothetical protein
MRPQVSETLSDEERAHAAAVAAVLRWEVTVWDERQQRRREMAPVAADALPNIVGTVVGGCVLYLGAVATNAIDGQPASVIFGSAALLWALGTSACTSYRVAPRDVERLRKQLPMLKNKADKAYRARASEDPSNDAR